MLGLLFVVTIAMWVGYEVWQLYRGAPTISEQTWNALRNYPPLGFLIGLPLGVVLGHLLWPASCIFR